MEGERRVSRPLVEVRREFTGFRLEAQVLIRAYELVVPVIRGSVAGMPASGTNDVPGKVMTSPCQAREVCA